VDNDCVSVTSSSQDHDNLPLAASNTSGPSQPRRPLPGPTVDSPTSYSLPHIGHSDIPRGLFKDRYQPFIGPPTSDTRHCHSHWASTSGSPAAEDSITTHIVTGGTYLPSPMHTPYYPPKAYRHGYVHIANLPSPPARLRAHTRLKAKTKGQSRPLFTFEPSIKPANGQKNDEADALHITPRMSFGRDREALI